jgi:hypothetical protein
MKLYAQTARVPFSFEAQLFFTFYIQSQYILKTVSVDDTGTLFKQVIPFGWHRLFLSGTCMPLMHLAFFFQLAYRCCHDVPGMLPLVKPGPDTCCTKMSIGTH